MDQIGPKLDHKGLKIVVLRFFFAKILFVQYALSTKSFCIIFQPGRKPNNFCFPVFHKS